MRLISTSGEREGNQLSQEEVAERLGLTRERIGQIERLAIRKLRVALEDEAHAHGKTPRQWFFGDE